MSAPYALTGAPAPEPRRISLDAYLRRERRAQRKSEWIDGTVRKMAGVRPRHLLIESSLGSMVSARLSGECVYLLSSVQIWLPESRLYTYPDGAVACPPRFAPELPTAALTNPRVIFEVLSPSTEGYDRRAKFRAYRNLDSFEDYVLIATDEPTVEVFSRPDWQPRRFEGLDAVALIPSLGIELPLADLYRSALTLPE